MPTNNPHDRLQNPMAWASYEQQRGATGQFDNVNPFSPTQNPWRYSRWNRAHGIGIGALRTSSDHKRRRRGRRVRRCYCLCG